MFQINHINLLHLIHVFLYNFILNKFDKLYKQWKLENNFVQTRKNWLKRAYNLHKVITVDDGTVTIDGTNAIASVVQRGGTVNLNTTGTTTAYTQRGGTLDLQQSEQARTITTLTQSPLNTIVRQLEGIVTITNYNRDSNYKFYNISMTEA